MSARGGRATLPVLLLLLVLLAPHAARAQGAVVAIRGGTVLPVSGPAIPGGTVLIRDGRIAAVGADVRVPAGATVVDATGQWVMPGLVDAMSYHGIAAEDLNETTTPVTPELRAIEAYYPFERFGSGEAGPPRAENLLSGGVTTHYIAPADRTVVGGQGAVVKAAGPSFDALVLREPAAIDITLGLQPASTFRESNRSPGNRMAVMSALRQALVRAQEYERAQQAWRQLPEAERRATPAPPRDLGMEALGRLLRGELPARVQANRTTEIRNAIRLADEFGFQLIIDSGASAYQMADELAARRVPVVLGPVSHPYVSGEEVPDADDYPAPDERSAAVLTGAGVPVALASFSRAFGSLGAAGTGRWLLLDAALAAGYGLPEDQVLHAVTLAPARILGVDDRVGSLEAGKDADVIILDGPPLSVKSWVDRVYIGGELVYQRDAAERPGR